MAAGQTFPRVDRGPGLSSPCSPPSGLRPCGSPRRRDPVATEETRLPPAMRRASSRQGGGPPAPRPSPAPSESAASRRRIPEAPPRLGGADDSDEPDPRRGMARSRGPRVDRDPHARRCSRRSVARHAVAARRCARRFSSRARMQRARTPRLTRHAAGQSAGWGRLPPRLPTRDVAGRRRNPAFKLLQRCGSESLASGGALRASVTVGRGVVWDGVGEEAEGVEAGTAWRSGGAGCRARRGLPAGMMADVRSSCPSAAAPRTAGGPGVGAAAPSGGGALSRSRAGGCRDEGRPMMARAARPASPSAASRMSRRRAQRRCEGPRHRDVGVAGT